MGDDEKELLKICKLFDLHNINYWVCHGTLLGIVREDRLLPWDHDIDLAVWDSEVSREWIVELMQTFGYVQESVFGDFDCLHFFGKNKKIDISFYKRDGDVVSIKWAAPAKSLLTRTFLYCVQVLLEKSVSNIILSTGYGKRFVQLCIILPLLVIRSFLSNKAKAVVFRYSKRFINYTGYGYPASFMEFKKMLFKGYPIRVPIDPDRCLEWTYGKDWRTPKQRYLWHVEADNLT